MTYITEFAIKGLVGRDGVYSQKLNRDVNIFFGLNGSGKTSLLKILHSALSNTTSELSRIPFERAEVKFYSVTYDKEFTRTIQQRKPSETPEDAIRFGEEWAEVTVEALRRRLLLHDDFQWKTTPVEEAAKGFRHSYLPTSRLWIGAQGIKSFENEAELDRGFQSILEKLWSTYMKDVLSVVRSAQEEGLANILKWILSPIEKRSKRTEDALDVETAFERVRSFLERQKARKILGSREEFSKRYSKSVILKSVVNYIDEVETRIEAAMSPRNKLQELTSTMFSGSKTIHFADDSINIFVKKKQKIAIAALSSGEKQILRILVEVLKAEDNTLIIDEPEISMHVDWQKDLISAMRNINPNVQLILATHSPEIMAQQDDMKIFAI